MKYLSIDPPQGFVTMDTEFQQMKFGILPFTDVVTQEGFDFLQDLVKVADVVIYENFRLRPDLARAQTGSEFFTVKVIGLIELLKDYYPSKAWIKHEPSQQMAEAHLKHLRLWNAPCFNIEIPGDKLSHTRSALAHLITHIYRHDRDTYDSVERHSLQWEDLTCQQIRKRINTAMDKGGAKVYIKPMKKEEV